MLVPRFVRAQDLPVCLPGRQCVDEPPLAAPVLNAISSGTPLSSALSAGCFVVLGAALVLLVRGLLLQRSGSGVRPWLAALIAALLLLGVVLAYVLDVWFGTLSEIYSNVYGEPSAPVPASLIGSWPSVLFAGRAMVVLAAVALFAMLNTAVVRRRRNAPAQ